jgi:hypothetical protein
MGQIKELLLEFKNVKTEGDGAEFVLVDSNWFCIHKKKFCLENTS